MAKFTTEISLVDLVINAAQITQSIYETNGTRLAARDHTKTAAGEFKRAALMEALAKDENLCEMLAGRIFQLGAGSAPTGNITHDADILGRPGPTGKGERGASFDD